MLGACGGWEGGYFGCRGNGIGRLAGGFDGFSSDEGFHSGFGRVDLEFWHSGGVNRIGAAGWMIPTSLGYRWPVLFDVYIRFIYHM